MNENQRCPACGALNQCTLADPRTATEPCWCFAVAIDPAVLQALPTELRDQSCLCPRCAAGASLAANTVTPVDSEKR